MLYYIELFALYYYRHEAQNYYENGHVVVVAHIPTSIFFPTFSSLSLGLWDYVFK